MTKSKQKDQHRDRVERVADRLHSTAIHLLRVRRTHTASRAGPAQLSALSVLVFGGPLTLGQLTAAEQVNAPTMTRIVAGLRRSAWVLIPDPEDARRVRVFPTASGVDLLEQAQRRRIDYLAKGFARLTPSELAVVDKAVEIVTAARMSWE
ncbi:MAG TPA: MarR family transcriptional regulator [Terriglobales bacterium]|nr:MarR family transcriptional regulator [Terriglobales bacterium]